ncbi:ExbD/TolR family protein [Oleiharenicola lentus]|uniref:ExbD/TolR family protein n=1 Tax=Oleiharenicola lentus TaxID=2508720 RepID=UPI003F67E559
MARIFRRQRNLHPVAELNVTNLVDLGFTLLIIFMLAAPLIQNEQTIPVNLPEQSKSAQQIPPADTEYLSIVIDKAGQIFTGTSKAPISFDELSAQLAVAAKKPKQPVVRIRADGAIAYQKVIKVMDELGKQNLTKISFDTQTK